MVMVMVVVVVGPTPTEKVGFRATKETPRRQPSGTEEGRSSALGERRRQTGRCGETIGAENWSEVNKKAIGLF